MNYLTLAILSGLIWTSTNNLFGADEPKKDPPKVPPVKAADAPKEDADPYKLPDGADSATLVEFSKTVMALRSKVHSQAEFQEYQTKMRTAVRDASERIIVLEKGDSTDNGRFARRNLIGLGISSLMSGDAANKAKYMEEAKAYLTAHDLTNEDAGLIMGIGQTLERADESQAKEFYTFAANLMKKSTVPAIAAYSARLEGTVRRLGLMGNVMELKGTTVDGKAFDIASLKGKVVLVDFWATWCHYCIEELPNVKKNYAGYHNKGFEVVGISGDANRAKLDAFLLTEKLPWLQLHDKGGQNPAMAYYAIGGFPTTFLIGKDGKVISLSARGEELGTLLKRELGEPDTAPDATPKAAK